MGFYRIFDKVFYRVDLMRRGIVANNRVVGKMSTKLSREEYEEFKSLWNKCQPVSHEFYKGFGLPFDPRYVPNDYYDFAEHVLNRRWAALFLQHKGNLKYIIPESNRPKTILRKVNGHFVSEDNRELSIGEAKNLLMNTGVFVRKIALLSGGGRGVQKICLATENDPEECISQLMKPDDLIFQEVVSQSEFMASLNPDSVNTIRLVTLNINGNCSVLSSFIRMGTRGSFVDNLCSGGGALVGLNQDGELNSFGIRKDYSKCFETPTGLPFKDLTVPDWKTIKETVISFHLHIPYADLIGWDIAIEKDGRPIVIEVNLDSAEIEAHQIFNGPVFGERLEEVMQYIESKRVSLRHAMITF